jgi:hypothetical protein
MKHPKLTLNERKEVKMKNIPWKKLIAQGIDKNPLGMEAMALHRHCKKVFALHDELLIQGDYNALDMSILRTISQGCMDAIMYKGRPIPTSWHTEIRAWRKNK